MAFLCLKTGLSLVRAHNELVLYNCIEVVGIILYGKNVLKPDHFMTFFQQLKRWIERATTPPKYTERDGIRYWQDRILFSLLAIGVVLGFIAYVPSVILSLAEDLWLVAVFDTAFYAWAIFLFLKRSLPFKLRAYSTIVLSYLLALILLLTVGPFGAGPVWLFFFPVVTGLFLNSRSTLIALLINTITICGLGFALYFDTLGWRRAAGFPMESWVVIGINFLLLNALSAWAIVSLLRGLQNSLLLERDALTSVEQKNRELLESNVNLQKVIDDRKRFEEALTESKEALEESELKFQDLVNMLPLSYFLIDENFKLKTVNIKMLEMFKYPSEDKNIKLPETATDFIVPEEREQVHADLVNLIENHGNSWAQYTGLTSTGEQIPIEVLASIITINQKNVGVQGIILDITERIEHEKTRKAKEIAENTNKAISEWVGFIVHELRTPISGLLQFAQLGIKKLNDSSFVRLVANLEEEYRSLIEKPDDHDTEVENQLSIKDQAEERERRFAKYFNRVHTGGYRLQRLLNELLDISKLEAGKMEFHMQKSDMKEIIRETCDEMEAAIESDNLILEITKTKAPTEIICDAFRMGQVLRNLVNNSIKFSSPGSKITIAMTETKLEKNESVYPALQTTVSDQGVGIPEDQINYVFNMFKQSRKTRIGEGSGLGLPICRQIVNAHKGKIWAESEGDRGAKIHFIVPYDNLSD